MLTLRRPKTPALVVNLYHLVSEHKDTYVLLVHVDYFRSVIKYGIILTYWNDNYFVKGDIRTEYNWS
jgi:hypothetical protein